MDEYGNRWNNFSIWHWFLMQDDKTRLRSYQLLFSHLMWGIFCLGVISSLNSGCQNLKIPYMIDQRNNIASSSLIKIYLWQIVFSMWQIQKKMFPSHFCSQLLARMFYVSASRLSMFYVLFRAIVHLRLGLCTMVSCLPTTIHPAYPTTLW